MKMKRAFLVFLSCLMAVLVACSSGNGGQGTETSGADTTEKETVTVDDIEIIDYNGYDFTFYTRSCCTHKYSVFPDAEETEIVNEAAYARNEKIYELLNVQICEPITENDGYPHNLAAALQAGEETCDAILWHRTYAASLAVDGMLLNMANLEHFSFDEDWWASNLIDQYSYKDVGDCSWIKYTVTLVGFENTSTPPDTSDDDPIEPPTTTYPFVDVTGDPNWFETKEPVGNYDYSFCLVGDTQMVTSRYPEHLPTLYNWIADNAASKKMSYVIGLGDITDQDSKAEWEAAKNAIGKLNGVVPYLLLRGNQDTSYRFNATFGTDAYKSQCKGYYEEGKIENVYTIFKAGGVDYLLIAMDWSPSNQCLAWADGVIEQFPNHRVIISTHSYLYKDGTTVDAEDPDAPDTFASPDNNLNNGDEIWNKLVSKHENIFLVLSGHIGSDDVVVSQRGGAHGNVVTQVLANPQDVDAEIGATGMVAMLYISESNSTITIEQYSTVRGMYYRQESQQVVSFAGKMTPDTDVGTEPDSETSEMLPSVTDEVEESESADGHSDTHEEILILVIPIVVAVAVVVVLVLFRIRKKKR